MSVGLPSVVYFSMQSVVILSVVMSVGLPSVVYFSMQSVVILSVVMLTVVTPFYPINKKKADPWPGRAC
jgi:hypothetical protein